MENGEWRIGLPSGLFSILHSPFFIPSPSLPADGRDPRAPARPGAIDVARARMAQIGRVDRRLVEPVGLLDQVAAGRVAERDGARAARRGEGGDAVGDAEDN